MKADFLICGGGIVGLTIARELLKRGIDNIVVIEKERNVGMHASGRNSGVLHAGIYYTPESLKARFCLRGNFMMKEYCREKGIRVMETGKVIVAKDESEIDTLKELYNRAVQNGAKVEMIDERRLEEIEPFAKTSRLALYSYYTAVTDPAAINESLRNDLISSGKATVMTDTKFQSLKGSDTVMTDRGEIGFRIFINAAGAYSDRVAHEFGVGSGYMMIPFKGIYRKLRRERSGLVNGNIYPVPDIRNPFLGIHFTKGITGDVYLGPTAIPAFGRENYGTVSGLDGEAFSILMRDVLLFFRNPKFSEVAKTETKKYCFKSFFEDSRKLVKDLNPGDVIPCDKVGIRPQLVDWENKELIMDFKIIKDGASVHVLNAISPAFTSSMSFAEFVVSEYVMN